MSDDVVGMKVVQVLMNEVMRSEIDAMAEQEKREDESRPNRARTIRRLIRKGLEAERKAAR